MLWRDGCYNETTRTHTELDTHMTGEHEEYIAIVKALYDYEPSSEDELAMNEGQILFLVEKTDEE
jgi:SH3 domain